jgi:hypothetical protein
MASHVESKRDTTRLDSFGVIAALLGPVGSVILHMDHLNDEMTSRWETLLEIKSFGGCYRGTSCT